MSKLTFKQRVLGRSRGADKFDTVVRGDVTKFCELFPDVYELLVNKPLGFQ